MVKFEEHRFGVRRGIVLLIFRTNVSNFPGNYNSVLQTKVWKNENLNCGFPSDAISLKCDQEILLPSTLVFNSQILKNSNLP